MPLLMLTKISILLKHRLQIKVQLWLYLQQQRSFTDQFVSTSPWYHPSAHVRVSDITEHCTMLARHATHPSSEPFLFQEHVVVTDCIHLYNWSNVWRKGLECLRVVNVYRIRSSKGNQSLKLPIHKYLRFPC